MLATCSDDHTVAVWDFRLLKGPVRMFRGHTNWVKNIEYLPEKGLLLTSGFDGYIYSWDINRFVIKLIKLHFELQTYQMGQLVNLFI